MYISGLSFEVNISGEMEFCLSKSNYNEIALWIERWIERECDRAINGEILY